MGIWADLNAVRSEQHPEKRRDNGALQNLAECSTRVVCSPGLASWCGGVPPLSGEPGHSGQNPQRVTETADGVNRGRSSLTGDGSGSTLTGGMVLGWYLSDPRLGIPSVSHRPACLLRVSDGSAWLAPGGVVRRRHALLRQHQRHPGIGPHPPSPHVNSRCHSNGVGRPKSARALAGRKSADSLYPTEACPGQLTRYSAGMTQKEMVLEAIRELPDDASVREIADRLEFLAVIQSGIDQLDRGAGVPHEEVKRQLASWLTR